MSVNPINPMTAPAHCLSGTPEMKLLHPQDKVFNYRNNTNPFILAPLAGITDMPFRKLCHEQGAALVYSEMVSAKALHYRDAKSFAILETDPDEGRVALQLFGSDPDIMAEAAQLLDSRGHAALDVNMGCPVPKVVRNGEGSALMRDPNLAGKIVEAMVKATSKPVTVKIRSGWDADNVNAVKFARMMEAAGASMIAVHGRTRDEYYSGKSDRGIIAAVKRAVSVPVAGSGDVFTARDAIDMLAETGCDYVMIARGALGNPWIFREAKMLLSGASDEEIRAAFPTPTERGEMFIRQLDDTIKLKGEKTAVLEMRKHAGWYFKGLPGVALFRDRINRIVGAGEMRLEVMGFAGGD
jgi:tRNA-dihydrouridine synthase B